MQILQILLAEVDALQQLINAHYVVNNSLRSQIQEYYRIALTYTSNALEGNSLTETETKIVLEDGLTIGGKPLRDHFEAIGHSDALTFLYTLIDTQQITEAAIQRLHHLFYFRIDEANAGVYRKQQVYISGSKYALPAPDKVPELMIQFIKNFAQYRTKHHPVVSAALAHKDFVFIHPYIDGNGRVARLLMNLVLLQEGYSMVIIPPIMRRDYMASLEKAHANDEDFILLIARMVKETMQDYLRLMA
jgi:Fic family protein